MGNSCSSDQPAAIDPAAQPKVKPSPVQEKTGQSAVSAPSGSSGAPVNLNNYEIEATLGVGASCKVQSVRDKTSGKKYAMKVIQKTDLFKEQWAVEVRILQMLKHPNILEYVTSFEESKELYIVTGFCAGGELFDRVTQGKHSEKDAARLTHEMLSALAYCHSKNVVHRDLKPENFVFDDPSKDSLMRLIDFGCAKQVQDEEIVTDNAGSPYYVAPEVLRKDARTGRIWKSADMWSIGVIIYLLVTGFPPFNGETTTEIFQSILAGRLRFPSSVPLSDSVKELIRKLLIMDPRARLTPEQALAHPWVKGENVSDAPLPPSVTKAIGEFQAASKLKKAVGKVLSQRMSDNDAKHLQAVFAKFDKNGDGQLGPDEILALMKSIGNTDREAKEFMAKYDEDNTGGISLDELKNAEMQRKLEHNEEIKAAFQMFDADRDGVVTAKELERLCDFLTPDQTKTMIGEVDKNGDGRINFTEWLSAMREASASLPKTQ